MKIVDMKKGGTDNERVPHNEPSQEPQDEYHYGTRISLDHEGMQKLGMFEPPQVGTSMPMGGKGVVVSAHKDATTGKHHMEMQITHLGFEHGQDSAASKLYDKGPGDGA